MVSHFQHFKVLEVAAAAVAVERFTVKAELAAVVVFFTESRRLTFVDLFDFDFPFLVEATVAKVAGFFVFPFGAQYAKSRKTNCSGGKGVYL